MKEKCLIVAEAGVNHNGSLELAFKLCDAAKNAGADIIKFQTWKTDKLLTKSIGQADYQIRNNGINESQYEMLKKLELSYDDFSKIKKHCDDIGIVFASTADEEDSLDFLVDLGIPFIKVGSGDVGNVSFLRHIGSKNFPVVLSTGMSSLTNVAVSVDTLSESGASAITILHCTTNYPCPYDEVNLNAMLTLRDAFHLPVGYSDHTSGTEIATAAVSMGAVMIEKHLTLDRGMKGPDHISSVEPDEFKLMVQQIRNVEIALGDGNKVPTSSERLINKSVAKRIVAATHISKGEKFTTDNICVKRSEDGEVASNYDVVIRLRATHDYEPDEGIVI